RSSLALQDAGGRSLLKLSDRARAIFRGLSPSPPAKVQLYNVACPEGHRLRGERTVGYQALRCPACGEAVFVLPRSSLPEPPVPAPSSRARTSVTSGPLDLEPAPIALDVVALRLRLADWARRRRNPLLFLAVGLLIVATAGIRQWRQHRQDLPRIAALGRVEGLAALDEGKFDKAYQLLSAARRAV